GSQGKTQPILVDDTIVVVTSNLYSALTNLRRGGVSRVIWIDALCINQCDSIEKSWQVQLMGEIYQKAAFVIVWIG
ncbi:heterokaryon incompatibility, partial [Halenospora varia]